MSVRKLIRNAITTFVTTLVLSSAYAYAAPNGEVLFSATEGGKPIMRTVQWEIFNLDSNSKQEDVRHTFTVKLPPGEYLAKLRCDGKDYERPFTIATPFHNVLIECGH